MINLLIKKPVLVHEIYFGSLKTKARVTAVHLVETSRRTMNMKFVRLLSTFDDKDFVYDNHSSLLSKGQLGTKTVVA